MKKIVSTFILVTLLAVSCNNRFEEDIFPNTPTERVAKAIDQYKSLLASSKEGWVLEYYPGGRQREYGGYTYTLKFTETEVTALSDQFGPTDSLTTKYNIIPNAGPTLTFDDYNRVFHYLVTPSQSSYNASRGDYEFLILSHENDVITLKGKKYGSKMKLRKLTQNMSIYMDSVQNMFVKLSSKKFLNFVVNGKSVDISDSARNTIAYTYDENGTLKTESMAYAYTDKGIRFYEPIVIDGVTIEELIFNENSNTLDLADGTQVIFLPLDLSIDLLKTSWNILVGNATTASDLVNNVFEEITEANKRAYNHIISSVRIGFMGNSSTESTGIRFFSVQSLTSPRGYEVIKGVSFYGTLIPGEVGMTLGGNGRNWRFFSHFLPFVSLIVDNAPYATEPDNANNPTQVKFTSTKNPNVWFVIKKR